MSRVPLTVRLLVLLPLMAAAIDLTRTSAMCGSQAQTCLEAARSGFLGPFAILVFVLYAAGGGVLLAQIARRRALTLPRLWALGTVGLVTACTGQELLARLTTGSSLGGTPVGILVFCAIAGALLALVMHAAAEAADFVADLAPRAPRTPQLAVLRVVTPRHCPDPVSAAIAGRPRGRAPPA